MALEGEALPMGKGRLLAEVQNESQVWGGGWGMNQASHGCFGVREIKKVSHSETKKMLETNIVTNELGFEAWKRVNENRFSQ